MKSPTRSSRTLPPSRLSPPVLVLAALAAILTTATTVLAAETDPSCFYTTQEDCREAALARGLSPGGGGFSFASDSWSYSKGCYFYSAGSGSSFAGRAFFGTGGTVEQMKTLGLPGRKERLYCETPGGADAPPSPSDAAEVAGGDSSPTDAAPITPVPPTPVPPTPAPPVPAATAGQFPPGVFSGEVSVGSRSVPVRIEVDEDGQLKARWEFDSGMYGQCGNKSRISPVATTSDLSAGQPTALTWYQIFDTLCSAYIQQGGTVTLTHLEGSEWSYSYTTESGQQLTGKVQFQCQRECPDGGTCNNELDVSEEPSTLLGGCRPNVATLGSSSTWCARMMYEEGTIYSCDTQYETHMSDPLRCIASPEKHYGNYHREACDELQLIDNVPTGYDESVAVECGTIPTIVRDDFTSRLEYSQSRLFCYYNVLTQEFCARAEIQDTLTTYGGYTCGSVEKSTTVWSSFGCRYVTGLKRGPCDEPADDHPSLVVPRSDEFVNARNERLNEEHRCSLQPLAAATANDVRELSLYAESCSGTDSGREACSTAYKVPLIGQDASMNDEFLIQRQGDNVCVAYFEDDKYSGGCKSDCIPIKTLSEGKRKVRTGFTSAGANRYSYSDTYFWIDTDGSNAKDIELTEDLVPENAVDSAGDGATGATNASPQDAQGGELSQPDGNDEEDTISISNAVAVNEYCDSLDVLEAHMDENYASLESGTIVTQGYECSCNEPDNMTLEIDCVMLYDNNGETGTNFEGIVFKKKNVGTGYELVQTSWGDSFYQDGTVPQETYDFEEGRLTGCTTTSCAFCKVCSDGASIALDCNALPGDLGWSQTCDDGITGSFANTFEFPALAANGSESSSAPSANSCKWFWTVTAMMFHALLIFI